MSNEYIFEILTKNGFNFLKKPDTLLSYIIKDLEIIHCEPLIKSVDFVSSRNHWTVFINFEDNTLLNPDLQLNIDAYTNQMEYNYLMRTFYNVDDFIEEIYKLNLCGKNIKG